jgi:hypothetical protein
MMNFLIDDNKLVSMMDNKRISHIGHEKMVSHSGKVHLDRSVVA